MVKPVEWTPEMVSRFWDALAEASLLSRFSFARSASPVVFRLVEPYLSRDADYIDYGGGDGHLCQYLIERGYRCGIFEPSKAGVRNFTQRMEMNPLFLGAFSSLEERTFDGIFCLEVIEHVLDEQLEGFLANLSRIIKQAGFVLVTCPNEEDLGVSGVICPNCQSYFHRWQHVRSVSLADVSSMLQTVGLRREWAGLIGFEAVEAIEQWCRERDDSSAHEKTGKKLPLTQRIREFFRSDEQQKAGDMPDLALGSQGNIVLIARKG